MGEMFDESTPSGALVWLRTFGAVFLTASLMLACSPQVRPQVDVRILAEPDVSDEATWLHYQVINNEGEAAANEFVRLRSVDLPDGPTFPFRLPPITALGEDSSRRFMVLSELYDTPVQPGAMDEPFNRLSARSVYVDGAVAYLRLEHAATCNLPGALANCGDGQTCLNGGCVGACVAPSLEADGGPTLPTCSSCQTCGELAECDNRVTGSACECAGQTCNSAGECSTGVSFTRLEAGYDHSCGVTGDRELYCWGSNEHGQLGSAEAPPVLVLGNSFDEAAGQSFTCAIDNADDSLLCWGWNDDGQLGLDDTRTRDIPTTLPANGLFHEVTTGAEHACARRSTGEVFCWGRCKYGQLGPNQGLQTTMDEVVQECADGTGHAMQTLVPLPEPVVELSAGQAHTCARLASGVVYCWGWNADGQLGTESVLTAESEPARIAFEGSDAPFEQLASARFHTCGRRTDGQVWCWGGGSSGNLGTGDPGDYGSGRVGEPDDMLFVEVACGGSHCCAIQALTRALFCWGNNEERQLGIGGVDRAFTPVPVAPGREWSSLGLGLWHTCGIDGIDGSIWCWGANESGQAGLDYGLQVHGPRRVCVP